MHDIKWIRENPEAFDAALKRRGLSGEAKRLVAIDERRRTAIQASEAALARRVPDHPKLAERFEMYVAGVELANGFGELTDTKEQRRRLVAQMDEKERIYGERLPIDEDFLAALGHMPPASGCALGFDRLVLLATGATHIDQVLWTPMG